MTSSYINRILRATLTLPQGNFPGTNSNTLVLEGYRMSAKLRGAGNFTNFCDIEIYGMRQVDMNAVTVIFAGPGANAQNVNAKAVLTLEAKSGDGNPLQVFQGQFQDASPDYRSLPDVNLRISAASGYGQQILSAPPTSVNGGADVADTCRQIAGKMGFGFEDNGVTGTLSSPYLAGTLMDQFRQVCDHANIDYYFDAKQTLIICPKNQPRRGQLAVVLSPTSGLIGYVTLARYGIDVDCLFDPAIALGAPIVIQDSDVPGTNGKWFPQVFEHELESIKPGGRSFSHLQCLPFPSAAPA